jgi:hypothetical protein
MSHDCSSKKNLTNYQNAELEKLTKAGQEKIDRSMSVFMIFMFR